MEASLKILSSMKKWFCLSFILLWNASAAEHLPNIVIILADDMGYADLASFGARDILTPNLDRLAKQGRRFTDFHVVQPVCSASRCGLLTGCYPNRLGINGALGPQVKIGISDGETTLAQLLKKRGYATGMAGKWHLGRPQQFLPTHHGFDEYLGLPYSNDMWPHHPERPAGYPNLPLIEGDQVIDADVTAEDQVTLTTRYTQRAVDFINRHPKDPFFFYLAYAMPHVPLFVSDKFKGKSKHGLYGDVIMEIDWSVGQVMEALKKNGLEKDTFVIFTSDNGPWLSYGNHAGSALPLREGKGTSWEGGTRVPCIMRWPGKIPKGTTSDQYFVAIDLFPTIAAITKSELPPLPIDGLNVLPLITGQKGATNPHEAYANYYEVNQLQAVTSGDGRWKLVLPHQYRTLAGQPGGTNGIPAKYSQVKIEKPELYDLKSDLSEKSDVASLHPEIVERLSAFAEKMRDDIGDALTNRKGKNAREPGRAMDVN
jgi:arylsulfatase A